jgi:hypothetical protein
MAVPRRGAWPRWADPGGELTASTWPSSHLFSCQGPVMQGNRQITPTEASVERHVRAWVMIWRQLVHDEIGTSTAIDPPACCHSGSPGRLQAADLALAC